MRLNKELARAGIGSRRAADAAICDGRVCINGQVVKEPWREVDLLKDEVTLDGKNLSELEPYKYFILNKPKGYVCSSKRYPHKRIVLDLFDESERLFTVGRLDKETTGLLIVTNDGDFSNRVIHPNANLSKEYVVKAHREITHEDLVTIGKGILIDGVHVKPTAVKKVRRNTLKVVVKEGKKHEVRLLVKSASLEVDELNRVRIGNLSLGNLPLGAYREMRTKELETIFD